MREKFSAVCSRISTCKRGIIVYFDKNYTVIWKADTLSYWLTNIIINRRMSCLINNVTINYKLAKKHNEDTLTCKRKRHLALVNNYKVNLLIQKLILTKFNGTFQWFNKNVLFTNSRYTSLSNKWRSINSCNLLLATTKRVVENWWANHDKLGISAYLNIPNLRFLIHVVIVLHM